MKNYIILLFLLFLSLKIDGQTQRFIYEYSFKPDSLNKENVIKEIMNLDISDEGSTFYSNLLLDKDSIFMDQVEKGKISGNITLDFRNIKKSQANFIISKKYPSLEITLHTSFNALNLAVKENRILNWKIQPETNIIQGFKVQKATTNFAGRNWIAWFANDIQLQDGPYKFCGLPGLILNIQDENGDHIFNIIGIKKKFSRTFINHFKLKEITVTDHKFNQLWNEYRSDPAKNIKQIHSSSEMAETIFYDSNTKSPLSKQDLIRNKEQGDRKYFKYYNNYIERNLYK